MSEVPELSQWSQRVWAHPLTVAFEWTSEVTELVDVNPRRQRRGGLFAPGDRRLEIETREDLAKEAATLWLDELGMFPMGDWVVLDELSPTQTRVFERPVVGAGWPQG